MVHGFDVFQGVTIGYGVKIQAKDKAILKRYLSVNHRYALEVEWSKAA